MQRVEGVVYCYIHDGVHDDVTGPFENGLEDCELEAHRPVYVSLRKGDIPFEEDE